jgi:hypothetical protein
VSAEGVLVFAVRRGKKINRVRRNVDHKGQKENSRILKIRGVKNDAFIWAS